MLVVTSVEDATANMVIEALNERQVQVARVDPADIGTALTFSGRIGDGHDSWGGQLRTPSRDVALQNIGAVYWRRPSPWRSDLADPQAKQFVMTEARHGLGGLLRSLPNCRYVNHPASTRRADFKVTQLQVAAQLGMNVPTTLVTNDLAAARDFASKHEQAVYKSFRGASRTVDGYAATIWTQPISADDLDDSLSMTAHMFQEEIPKSSDARVTVVGRNVFASRITTIDGDLDWRSGDWTALGHAPLEVPATTVKALHAYLDHFGLVFGCFDFALGDSDAGEVWTFMECNPNGQWGWLPNFDGIAQAFADVLLKGWWS
ncbi:ATP-grasp ribosomal peptide maturase [Nonomuraea zeae]|uniref:ATP-grasp ribosomal peptide maturase n=1 Tax=Nonomuraea zeae TaxID=1642303 RepID=UPI003617EF96